MIRSLLHGHTRNLFPQRLSWLAEKKGYRYYYWWYKDSFPSCANGDVLPHACNCTPKTPQAIFPLFHSAQSKTPTPPTVLPLAKVLYVNGTSDARKKQRGKQRRAKGSGNLDYLSSVVEQECLGRLHQSNGQARLAGLLRALSLKWRLLPM